MDADEYLRAKAWLIEVEMMLHSDRVIVMPPNYYKALMELIDKTRAELAEYEAKIAQN